MTLSPIKNLENINRAMLLWLIFFCSAAEPSFGEDQNISALRSAYLYYFTNLIEWPRDTQFPNDTITLCALTTNNDDKFQLSTIDNKNVNKKTLRITFLNIETKLNVNTCNLVFIASSYAMGRKSLPINENKNILFVTEGDKQIGGDIKLFTDEKKLKFQINSELLTSKGFTISSKLLRLSKKERK